MQEIPKYIVVEATDLEDDGHGIAREIDGDSDREILVPDLLPGEVAEVKITHQSQHRKRDWAEIVTRKGGMADDRIAPVCPAYGQCGGCSWQHLGAAAQRDRKRMHAIRALSAKLSTFPEVGNPLASPKTLEYRNKGKYVFSQEGEHVVLGSYRPRSHEVVSTLGCRIVEPAIGQVVRELSSLAKASGLPIYDEKQRSPGLRYAILRSNAKGNVLVTLVVSTSVSRDALLKLATDLEKHSNVIGVLRCNNDLHSGGLLTDFIECLCGEATLVESIAGIDIGIGAKSFWQINRLQAEAVYNEIADSIRRGQRVLELYSGVGGIALSLARAGHRVTAVERDSQAVQAAQLAADRAGLSERVELRKQDATQLAPGDFWGMDVVVVDPPRKGLGTRGLKQLCDAMPPTIVYLSCGLTSLASDLAAFVAFGYQIANIKLYDFMPGTAQVESLVILKVAQDSDLSERQSHLHS